MTATAGATVCMERLGTTALLRVSDERQLELAVPILERELERIDRAASGFRADSELSLVLRAGGREVFASEALREAVLVALTAARLTDGLVDPTLGHLPGWRQVRVAERSVRVPAGCPLDLGATAKALAADRIAAQVGAATQDGVLVSLGGDIATSGRAPAGGWLIHVTDDHRSDENAPGQTVVIHGGALASSGTTVRRGPAGHHIIDPRTGQPARTPWRIVSVTAETCVDANTASTAAIVLGAAAPGWLSQRGLAARLVDESGAVCTVGGWPAEAAEQR